MIINVIMPKAGMAMEEGTIVRWLKTEGEYVKNGEELLEIETDKVNMTIEAEAEGYLLKVLRKVGDIVPVTQTIAYIGRKDDTLLQDTATPAAMAKSSQIKAKMEFDYDVIVLGGGPAGYVAAIRAAQLGARTALIEKDQLGGTCLNRGCIPTKTYLESAKILRTLKHCGKMGVSVKADSVSFSLKTACLNKNNLVKKLTSGVGALLKSYGVEVITGTGKILSDKTVQVADKAYTAHKIIVATGSLPTQLQLPGTDHKRVLDSTQLLDIDTLPQSLVIIGGGVIGVELACAFHSFGSDVTVIELLDRLIPNMDASLSQALQKNFTASGIHIHTSAKCESITENENGLLVMHTTDGDYEADYVLVATGRKPELSCIEQSGIAIEKGAVVVDAKMQTTVPGIYAPGDVNGRNMLAHAAFHMAEVAAENAMGLESSFDGQAIPSCIYTLPEVAGVGLTEEAARKDHDIITGQFSFGVNGRALAADLGEGFVKVIADKSTHEILGVHIIGPNATEMINEASLILHMEMDAEEMSQVIHAHPTYSEVLFEACMDCMGRSPHSLKKQT